MHIATAAGEKETPLGRLNSVTGVTLCPGLQLALVRPRTPGYILVCRLCLGPSSDAKINPQPSTTAVTSHSIRHSERCTHVAAAAAAEGKQRNARPHTSVAAGGEEKAHTQSSAAAKEGENTRRTHGGSTCKSHHPSVTVVTLCLGLQLTA